MISGRFPRIAWRTRSWWRCTSRRERRFTSHDRSTSSNREPNELAFLPEESSDASMRTPQSTIDGKRSAYSPTSKSTTSINQRLSDHRLATQQLAGVFQELPRALVAVAVVLGHGRIGEAGDDGVDLVLL